MLKRIVLVSNLLILPLFTTTGVAEAPKVVKKPKPVVKVETHLAPKKLEPPKKVVKPVAKKVQPKPIGQHMKMEITGYTAGYESTQKKKGQPGYGETASGTYVKQGRTIAAGKNIPFGTKIYIPYFKGKPGFDDGIFTVEDRGGAIGAYHIDVYFNYVSDARDFGRRTLDVYILGGK